LGYYAVPNKAFDSVHVLRKIKEKSLHKNRVNTNYLFLLNIFKGLFFIINRLFLSNHEYINVPINIVMVSKPGLYSSEHIIDFGVASRNGLVTSKTLNLCNSAKSSIIVQV